MAIMLSIVVQVSLMAQDKSIFAMFSPDTASFNRATMSFDSVQKVHEAYQAELSRNGQLLLSGYLKDQRQLYLLNTHSVAQAETWLSTNPVLKTRLYHVELLPLTQRTGHLCPPNDTSSPAEELTIIHYTTHIAKFNIQDAPELFRKHDDHLDQIIKTGNVLWEGLFDNDDGGIMIMKGKLLNNVILSDPAVVNGIIEPEIITLQITRGAFCTSQN